MNYLEFEKHLGNGLNIIVSTKSGTEYYLNADQLENQDNDLVYGYLVSPKPREKVSYRWFRLKNVKFVRSE